MAVVESIVKLCGEGVNPLEVWLSGSQSGGLTEELSRVFGEFGLEEDSGLCTGGVMEGGSGTEIPTDVTRGGVIGGDASLERVGSERLSADIAGDRDEFFARDILRVGRSSEGWGAGKESTGGLSLVVLGSRNLDVASWDHGASTDGNGDASTDGDGGGLAWGSSNLVGILSNAFSEASADGLIAAADPDGIGSVDCPPGSGAFTGFCAPMEGLFADMFSSAELGREGGLNSDCVASTFDCGDDA